MIQAVGTRVRKAAMKIKNDYHPQRGSISREENTSVPPIEGSAAGLLAVPGALFITAVCKDSRASVQLSKALYRLFSSACLCMTTCVNMINLKQLREHVLSVKFETHCHLINTPFHLTLQYQRNKEFLNFFKFNVELLQNTSEAASKGKLLRLTFARKESSSRVYGLIRSMRYCVLKLRKSSPM